MMDTYGCTSFEPSPWAGSMLMQAIKRPMLVGVMLAGIGTSTAPSLPAELVHQALQPAQQTTPGAALVVSDHSGSAIAELRRLSGLSWDQLAQLFSVTRRALHFWASGKPMTPANEEHLQRLLTVLRKIDRGSATANRRELLASREKGAIALDLLHQQKYDSVVSLIGIADARHRITAPKLSPRALALRTPPSPEHLVGAVQDGSHHDLEFVRSAKSVRVKSDS